jgi:signal transduction histidine kinase
VFNDGLTERPIAGADDQSAWLASVPGEAVEVLVRRSALRAEHVFAIIRIAFCVVVLVRFLLVSDHQPLRMALTLPPSAAAILFGMYVLTRRQYWPTLSYVSVATDATTCFIGLLPNALWPSADYAGLLAMPDVASLVLVTLAAGARHSLGAALLGALLNLLSFGCLVAVDRTVSDSHFATGSHGVTLYTIFIVAAGVLAAGIASGTRRLVRWGAVEAIRAERAQRGIGAIFHDHHDVRSLLSSATMNADLLVRYTGEPPRTIGGIDAGRLAREIRTDLEEINDFVSGIQERTKGEVERGERMAVVDARASSIELIESLRPRFPETKLELRIEGSENLIKTIGGRRSFERIVTNLVVNGCEGNGTACARTVCMRLSSTPDRLRLIVEDDGPGFRAEQLGRTVGEWESSKADGRGMGLKIVSRLLRASSGTLTVANGLNGGAVVCAEVPLASSVEHQNAD